MKQVGQKYGHLAQLAALCNAEKQELSDATKSPVSLNAHLHYLALLATCLMISSPLFKQTPKDPLRKFVLPIPSHYISEANRS